jgi:hypothetical protein
MGLLERMKDWWTQRAERKCVRAREEREKDRAMQARDPERRNPPTTPPGGTF